MQRKNFVVIMAAGSGSRMGASRPKQFLDLGGRMILQRTIEIFMEACPDITVVTVLPPDFIDFWRGHCLEQNFICPQITVPGGITRFHSVRNALQKVPDGAVVAVHDGVRPLVSVELVREMFRKAVDIPALIPVLPCIDTMKVLKMKMAGSVPLRELWPTGRCSMPPRLRRYFIRRCSNRHILFHTTPRSLTMPLWCRNMEKASPYTMGERLNVKITTQEDLLLAEAVISLRDKA